MTNTITKDQVNFLIQSTILLQQLSKEEATLKVSKYILDNNWTIK